MQSIQRSRGPFGTSRRGSKCTLLGRTPKKPPERPARRRPLCRKRKAPTKRRKHYIVFHDLRHTFASHWMSKGGDLFRLQRILGHKSPTMTNRYAHLAPEAYVTDYARLGAADQFTSKVLPFPQATTAPGR